MLAIYLFFETDQVNFKFKFLKLIPKMIIYLYPLFLISKTKYNLMILRAFKLNG